MAKARKYRSKIVQRLLTDIEKAPWHVKLKLWMRTEIWVLTCKSRKYWDKSFSGYIFKKQTKDR